jgi:hypothetical protein
MSRALPSLRAPRAGVTPPSRQTLGLGALALGVGALVALLPPLQTTALLVAAAVVPLALARPLLALCLAVATIPLSSEWTIGLGGLNLTLMEPAVALAAVAWLLGSGRRRCSWRSWSSSRCSW